MPMEFNAHMPVKIVFGAGRISSLGEIARLYGKRLFIATMKEIVEMGLLKDGLSSLERSGMDYVLYTDVKPEPKSDDIDSAVDAISDSGCDVVAGVGGGSCIDFAKALAICARHPGKVWSYVNLSNRPPEPVDCSKVLPVIAVPTTAGTGSEVTPYAVVTNTQTVQKGTIKESAIFPAVAIVDPELTLSLPTELTASTGIDALAHAIESYFNASNRTPCSDMIVEESLRWIVRHLPVACRNGNDLRAREGMAWGSTLAGMAISQAGTTVAHAMAQPLGARMGLSHSVSVAVFLLSVMRQTLPEDTGRFARIARIFGASEDLNEYDLAVKGVDLLERFLEDVGMTPRLSDFGADDGLIDGLVEDVTSYMARPLKQHAKVFAREDLQQIVRMSF